MYLQRPVIILLGIRDHTVGRGKVKEGIIDKAEFRGSERAVESHRRRVVTTFSAAAGLC